MRTFHSRTWAVHGPVDHAAHRRVRRTPDLARFGNDRDPDEIVLLAIIDDAYGIMGERVRPVAA
ncbi:MULTISPECIES: hypothetical protein [Hyphomonas]|uniref:hypothetical protein n=1 Tax=Hyphomonas TaxID=85 RepID=UPI0035177109